MPTFPIDPERPPFAAILGDPVAQSLSPALHAFWLRSRGAKGAYIAVRTPADDASFEQHVRALQALGCRGANITKPHKLRAFQIADVKSERSKLAGAANMLSFRPDGKIHADNSDIIGVSSPVSKVFEDGERLRTLIIGAGGAAGGAIAALKGRADILVRNRTQANAEALAASFQAENIRAAISADLTPGSFDLILNASSLGMTGNPPLELDTALLAPNGVFFDAVYAPLETAALKQAKDAGVRTIDGLDMLIAQAGEPAREWFGIEPPEKSETRAFLEDYLGASQ